MTRGIGGSLIGEARESVGECLSDFSPCLLRAIMFYSRLTVVFLESSGLQFPTFPFFKV